MKRTLILLAMMPLAFGLARRGLHAQDVLDRPAEFEPLPFQVDVEERDGLTSCIIRAENEPVHRIVTALAERLDKTIEGLDATHRSSLATVELVDRPVRQALEYILGSVGLRHEMRTDTIVIAEMGAEEGDVDQLLDLAVISYVKATAEFPHHPLGSRARLAQGAIEVRRGNDAAAITHYEFVLENFRASPEVPRAMSLAAEAMERLGLYGEANLQYRDLANLETEHGLEREAWLGIARTTNALADHQGALNVLNAMAVNLPPVDKQDRRERLLQRIRALNGVGDHREALQRLDELDALGLDEDARSRTFALRAEAFEGLDLLAESGRAWLIHAKGAEGDESGKAFENAARLALRAGDELGALLVVEEAEAMGMGARMKPYALAARQELGLAVDASAEAATPLERLAIAEEMIATGRVARAANVLESLWSERDKLEEGSIARIYRARATVIDETTGIDEAIGLLRRARANMRASENRAMLDVAAAELFEKYSRFAEAVDAYGGDY